MSLLVAVVLSLGLSAILVYVLSAPLRQVLNALCASGESSRFWVSFTSVMLFIAPLLLAVLAISPRADFAVAQVLRTTLISTLLGSSLALTVVGLNIASSTPRPKASRQDTPDARWEAREAQ
jgi:hypothetical protein